MNFQHLHTDEIPKKEIHSYNISILPDTEGSIKMALTSINRCVVVDKGDMRIPWFMGTFVEDRSKQLASFSSLKGMSGHLLLAKAYF